MIKFITASFGLFIFSLAASAQKEINNWCFPTDARMDFNSGAPVVSGCAMNASYQEGCSSISDANGTMLFYTDGSFVRDANNNIMPNGSGLLGSYTSSEGALIVQQPGSTTIFYVFTLDYQSGPLGLHVSTVDMSLNGGLGDVSVLNTQLSPGTIFSEKMIGIRHANGNDIWVVVHQSYTNSFYCYLITSSGINMNPVITNVGQVYTMNDDVGTMHCTFDGSRIAAAYWGPLSGYEIFDFDNSTGILSNPIYLTDPAYTNAYSVCFSPNGRYLYGGCYNTNKIMQFDLQQANPSAVAVASTPLSVGDMQLGPDSNIYIALTNHSFVSAIYDPDSAAPACNYVQNAVALSGTACDIGITNYVYPSGNVQPVALFNAPNHICPGTCTDFINISQHATSYLWTFGGATPSTSTDVNPSNVCYNTPGTYSVSLVATNANGSDTLTLNNYVTVYPYPLPQGISQNGDTLIAIAGANAYQWYFGGNIIPGATDYYYIALQSGNYNVVATDANNCEVEAVIFDVVAGIDLNDEQSVLIYCYPNPAYNVLHVRNAGLSTWSISVINAIGEQCLQKNISASTSASDLDVMSLAKGIYWIEFKSDSYVIRHKFLKN